MNLDPPGAAPAVFPAKGGPYQDISGPHQGHTRATSGPYQGVSGPYQQGGSGVDQLGAAIQQKDTTAHGSYGIGIPESEEAALARPVLNMPHLTAGMRHDV